MKNEKKRCVIMSGAINICANLGYGSLLNYLPYTKNISIYRNEIYNREFKRIRRTN